MKLITRDTDYALRSLCFIARQKNRVVSAAELVKELSIPRPFLRKILQLLNREGILESYKGKGGGFMLARSPAGIFLVDLMKIFQGPFILNECFLNKMACPRTKRCVLRKKINAIQDYVRKELKCITIASLLKEGA